MKRASHLLAAVAVGCLVVPFSPAMARAKAVHPARGQEDASTRQELAELRAEVNALKEQLAAGRQEQATTQAQLADTRTQVGAMQSEVAAAPVTARAAADTAIATALDREHHKDHSDYRGISIKPGGFLELAGIYRNHYQGNDIGSSFAIPFANNRAAHTSEGRFSARQSRLSLLAQGKANKDTTLTMYGEFDFLGGAQTANSNESNSYNLRVRNLYGAIDWDKGDHGYHLLAGQSWSLVTMNTKGITARNEAPPPGIDAQYVAGFAWTRQPQVRLAADFLDHKLWVAVSAENAATTFGGTVPSTVTNVVQAGSGFDSANTLSLNHIPDFVGKVAYEGTIAGRSLHLEGFGLSRTFTAHLNGGGNVNKGGWGVGGGIMIQAVPKLLDLQFSALTGKGVGRYGTSQLPDVAFDAAGNIHPIRETMLLAGATLHPSSMLDVYVFAGQEQQERADFGSGYGIGLLTANNSGCYTEGGTCAGNTRRIRQITGGFWQKIYNGNFGKAQVGVQYSHTQRDLFEGVGGAPQASQDMGFLSFRYYPF